MLKEDQIDVVWKNEMTKSIHVVRKGEMVEQRQKQGPAVLLPPSQSFPGGEAGGGKPPARSESTPLKRLKIKHTQGQKTKGVNNLFLASCKISLMFSAVSI